MTDRIQELEEELAKLRKNQSEMRAALDAMREITSKRIARDAEFQKNLLARIGYAEHRAVHADNLILQILESRIWRTLQMGGSILLNAARMAQGRKKDVPQVLTAFELQQQIQMRCDSLPPQAETPVAGAIEIRGWAIAENGIESVEVQVGNAPKITAQYGGARPDIGQLFPKMKNSLHSGFVASFDTRALPDGLYQATILARSRRGMERSLHVPLAIDQVTGVKSEYSRWLEIFETRDAELIDLQVSSFYYRPKISVLVPVFRTNLAILSETIHSVRKQSYPNWELCLVDDGSEQSELTTLLEKSARLDPRIRFATRTGRGGISAASNDALAMATGEYIALLDHDDLLAEDALFHIVSALQTNPRADLLYSDEDHIDETGRRFSPFFKPDWSPDLILSENYVCHMMAFERELALKVGGFRSEFDLSQDHDILLRMSSLARDIVHIPRILYHWRTSLHSMQRASDTGDRGISSSRAVVENFVKGRATVEEGRYPGRWRVRYPIPEGSRVSILIPTAGKTEVLSRNLKAIAEKAGHDDYEVVIIDNSQGSGVIALVDQWRNEGQRIRSFDQRGEPFNYSRLNNLAVASCKTPLLLFLNDDVEAISQDWLTALVELAVRREVGAVGSKLLYPEGLIQHAGVTMGLSEVCGHSFKGLAADSQHYFDFPDLIRNVSALTAACVMMRSEVFHQVGGFDEELFPVAYNDIDLTLKVGFAGYRVLYTPHAQLYHYEAYSKSARDLHPQQAETLALKNKWQRLIERDPFYNPNLTRQREDWSLGWN